MNAAPTLSPQIREDVLRDSRYPVHKIADQLLPYLQVLVEQFHPEQVILFGSYAYGEPNQDSDVDLLVVKPMESSGVDQSRNILKAWRSVRWHGNRLAIELLVVSPQRHAERLHQNGGFYTTIVNHGLRLA